MSIIETVDGKVCMPLVENLFANIPEPFLTFDTTRQHKFILFRAVLYDSSERINFTVCIPLLYTRFFFHSLLSILHYFGVITHAVIYMLVSFAGGAVTSIMAPFIAFPLQF